MDAFPDGWGSEANRHEDRALPHVVAIGLAGRVARDHPEHAEWLRQIKRSTSPGSPGIASGAIRQRVIHETTASEQYGTGECALIQSNRRSCLRSDFMR